MLGAADERRFKIPFDPANVGQSLRVLGERLREQAVRSRTTKVRIKYQGRQIGPDLPLGLVLAGEGLGVVLTGPLMALAVHLGAAALLDVELFDEVEERIGAAREAWAEGEVEAAISAYEKALNLRPRDPQASFELGVIFRVIGRREDALRTLGDVTEGPLVEKAERVREKLRAAPRRI
jgi:hypothetical protein